MFFINIVHVCFGREKESKGNFVQNFPTARYAFSFYRLLSLQSEISAEIGPILKQPILRYFLIIKTAYFH